ncbi:hypothetical protein TTHERM_00137710 (macronuclear) [Tetrahymena thermophila SB210]|uniref:LBP/BPI/CETP family, carboxy-terminal domain protein n=1 Tax=Tetrahymena thermophila (strain SB210) TaxID=312017 RepID=I7M8R2_TETTS|nr:hypothetical protein TTHERM_00137710 [Tetrahymena thermophila SB210]EAR99508.1 hypothetical protein TTHERM_00137710 [Tetrahymena thermophila SB210]|eukprot:XP_001019753.1 hypothetical protein TTHERM_00137710 [Tetrahymena thermophila SB210]
MKLKFVLAIIFAILCFTQCNQDVQVKANDDIPELKLSLSTKAINKLVSFLGDMVDNIADGKPLKIPLNIDTQSKIGIYKIMLNNLTLANHTIPWNQNAIAIDSLSENVFRVSLNNLSLNFTANEDISLLWFIKIKNFFNLNITDLSFHTEVHLTPLSDPNSVGFEAQLKKTSFSIKKVELILQDQKFWNFIAKPLVWILKPLIVNPIVASIAQSVINKALKNFCQKPLQPEIKIGDYTYQFDINFPSGVQQQQSDLRIPVDIKKITNLNSTEVSPASQIYPLPDYYFTNHTDRYDFEILLGTGIINQLIWTLSDSKLLSLTINQSSAIMKNIPLQLNLQGVQLLLPGLYNEYAIRRKMPPTTGVYLQLYVPSQAPDVRLVGGRLVGTVNASIKFLVELDPDEYPVTDIATCNCDEAITIALQLYFAADIYTPASFKIGADVSNLQIVKAQKASGSIDFDGDKFSTNATLLIYNLLGIINQSLSQGIDIPLVSQASFLENITLIFEQGYIFVDVGINPDN